MTAKTRHKWQQDRADRFRVLHRDGFACRYCGAKPGSEFLEVDHLVPRSLGGSDEEVNLATACKTCNRRKSDVIFFPHDLIERSGDEDGWFVHKTFGEWSVVFCDDAIGIEKQRYGFIEASRLSEKYLRLHLYQKGWSFECMADMDEAIDYVERLVLSARLEISHGR